MKSLSSSLVLLIAALGLGACRLDQPDSPDAKVTNVNPPQYPVGEYPAHAVISVNYSMYMAESIQHHCSGPSPFFEFDSDSLDPEGKSTMANLAECMKTGPLKDKRIRLIGRTDPRGTEDYNEKLGLERAEKVKRFMVRHGIDASRIETISYGKQDAHPSPAEWAGDRRVQIELAD